MSNLAYVMKAIPETKFDIYVFITITGSIPLLVNC